MRTSSVCPGGLLVAVRGAAVLVGQRWTMMKPCRMPGYGIDTLLPTAGVTPWAMLSLDPLSSPWLGTKLMRLVLYGALRSLALKRAPAAMARRVSDAGAPGTNLFMASVAVAYHLWGVLRPWLAQGG
jgi:uncharacterized membrane protein SirB2